MSDATKMVARLRTEKPTGPLMVAAAALIEREAARLAEAEAEIARYNAESRQRQARLAEAERDGGKWREAALRVGESLLATGPDGYYTMTPEAWLSLALTALRPADSAEAMQK